MYQSKPRPGRSGFTLIEVMVAVGIFALLGASLSGVVRTMSNSYRSNLRRMSLDTDGGRMMVELIRSLRMAQRSSLSAVPAPPFSATGLTFRRTDRFVEGASATEWIDPERIVYDPVTGEVSWIEFAGLPTERVAHRCRGVAPLLEGEIANGLDDNGNGLIDEPGFCVELQGDVLTARFTLQGIDSDGRTTQRTWIRSVECRN